MRYRKGHNGAEIELNVGDKVEVIVRSEIYCVEGEEVIYHFGMITKLEEDGVWIKYSQDTLFEEGEEEFCNLEEIEYILHKEYDIIGYAAPRKGMTLSVRGETRRAIINFEYNDGSLTAKTIEEDEGERPIEDKDRPFIREVKKYGTPQSFSQVVFSETN